jgi:F420-non-reducing hydrogenase iron-sulfur subunit
MEKTGNKAHTEQGLELEIEKNWQPGIVAFLCNWCSYAGADLAGTSRLKYNPQIRIIRVPCSGRVNPLYILRAFADGADGVLVSGCHPGDCHYSTGNYFARRKFALLKKLMEYMGMDTRRIHFSWVSAAEGVKWSRVVNEVAEAVYQAGPFQGFEQIHAANVSKIEVTTQVGTEGQRHRGTKKNEKIQRFADMAKINDCRDARLCCRDLPWHVSTLCLCCYEPE